MTAPRAREQADPPAPPERRPPRRGGGSSPSIYAAPAAGRAAGPARLSGARHGLVRSARALAAAALLALSGTLALPATAEAQTEVWSATLTVGAGASVGDVPHGYAGAGADFSNNQGTFGALSDTDFALDNGAGTTTTYTIESLRWGTGSGSDGNLRFELDALPAETTSDLWRLHIGSDRFAFASARRSITRNWFSFSEAYLDLTPPAAGSEVTVRVTMGAPLPKLNIQPGTTVTVDEGGSVTFTVTLSEALTEPVTVNWSALTGSGDTADGVDLGSASGTLTIPANETSVEFSVSTVDDDIVEDLETFTVMLSVPSSNAQLGTTPMPASPDTTATPPSTARSPPPPSAPTGGPDPSPPGSPCPTATAKAPGAGTANRTRSTPPSPASIPMRDTA